jgi:asparagine synthase (glutamine-hydrolysing)
MLIEGAVGLGIQRLSVIDLVTGDQPIHNEDRTVTVVMNGEIYNFRGLRQQLERRGHRFATRTDTEVVVHLYEERGPRFVEELAGMFAIALWDRANARLVLVRDRVGKKPLFYAEREGTLTFASEIQALARDDELDLEPDPHALDCYLAHGYVPAPLTAFRGVSKLPPAVRLTLDERGLRCERYWHLDFARKRHPARRDELTEELRDLIARAVRRRMVADVPVGLFLSGGMDSSVIAAVMSELSPQPLKTFSVGFAEDGYDEQPYGRLVADAFGTSHHELRVAPDVSSLIPRMARHYGEPFADSSAVPCFYLAEAARREVTVALNGDGGDEVFAGYPRYIGERLMSRTQRLPRSVRVLGSCVGRSFPESADARGVASRVRRHTRHLAASPVERYVGYMTFFDAEDRCRLYTDEYREQVDEPLSPAPVLEAWMSSTAEDVVDRMLDVDTRTYLPGDLLPKMDIATMAHSLEARSPLLDHEVMEFMAALPGSYKVRGLQGKRLLREAFRGRVPEVILRRPKRGFEAPIGSWLRGQLRDFAQEMLDNGLLVQRGAVRPERVRTILNEHLEARRDNTRQIWSLLMLEVWQREFGLRPVRSVG